MLKTLLAHPLTRGMDIDSPETTLLRRRIVREKKFLEKLYGEWYRELLRNVPDGDGTILELGSGAGFIKDFDPSIVTSEVFLCAGVDRRIDACKSLPFDNASLKAILMTDVFHHLPDVGAFFEEASRVVMPGGVISMIEPWSTPWSRFVYTKLHHEPFDPSVKKWSFPSDGPLSGANGALPWIVFSRDRKVFEDAYPAWRIEEIRPMMPVAYLLSGGISLRALFPGCMYGIVRGVEKAMGKFQGNIAMFARITLRRSADKDAVLGGNRPNEENNGNGS
jgi:Methylase involved in ubiquinone/menaquinone biosynthesis